MTNPLPEFSIFQSCLDDGLVGLTRLQVLGILYWLMSWIMKPVQAVSAAQRAWHSLLVKLQSVAFCDESSHSQVCGRLPELSTQ